MKRKQKLIKTLKRQLADLTRVWEQQELEISNEEYIKRFDSLEKWIAELEGWT